MAVDALGKWGMEPASLGPETLEKLRGAPADALKLTNPVDISKTPPRALPRALGSAWRPRNFGDSGNTHQPVRHRTCRVAHALAPEIHKYAKPVLAVWMGGEDVAEGVRILNDGDVPVYETPEQAVDTFMAMYSYTRNLELLQEIPAQLPQELEVNHGQAQAYIQECLKRQSSVLSEMEAKAILAAYGIPVTPTISASSSLAAVQAAGRLGYPVVMKIHSPQITYKSEVGGVRIDLKNEAEVRQAFEEITATARTRAPEAQILGVTLQPMVRPVDFELIMGARKDPEFGPVMLFGLGGIYAEVLKDVAIALPPLNLMLADRMMQRTRIYRLLEGYRALPRADLPKLAEMLMRLSQLVTEFSEIVELTINPLLITRGQPLAGDALIVVEENPVPAPRHLIIRLTPTSSSAPGCWETAPR